MGAGIEPGTRVGRYEIQELLVLDDEPPPLAAYIPDAPESLQEVVSDALTKDREARFQTAKQLLSKPQRLKRRFDAGGGLDATLTPDSSAASGETSGRTSSLGSTTVGASLGWGNRTTPTHATAETMPTGPFVGRAAQQAVDGAAGLAPGRRARGRRVRRLPLRQRAAGRDRPGGAAKIYTFPAAGGAPARVIDAPADMLDTRDWPPDGKAIDYVAASDGVGNLFRLPLAGGKPRQLTDWRSDFIYRFAWSPDGKQLAVARGTATTDLALIKDFR